MLRLWPERLVVGLFPGQCWLRTGRRMEAFDVCADESDWMAQAFGRAVQGLRGMGVRGRSIDVVLSDSLARCSLLPWQDQQLSVQQLQAYARACFDRAGYGIDTQWTLDAGHRHFRAPGMAVAVKETLLRAMISAAAGQGMRLRTVTPLTSLAYWRHSPGRYRQHCMLFLHEVDRVTLLRWEDGRIAALDVQPVAANVNIALRRLIQRQPARAVSRVDVWSFQPTAVPSDVLVAQFPDVPVHYIDLSTGVWR